MNASTRTDCCASPLLPPPIETANRRRLVTMFKALADSTRLDVFQVIASQPEPICVCDVVDQFGVSQPTISHHLKVLREAGLITVSRRGVWAYYALDADGIAVLRGSFNALGLDVPVAVR